MQPTTTAGGAENQPAKQSQKQTPWTLGAFAAPNFPIPRPIRHILPGQTCNHGPAVRFNGRMRVAHSLQELENMVADRLSITVALTLGQAEARKEVEDHVAVRKLLAVKRADEQCLYCAVRMAHSTGALVVIG
jgi:hypothetical protein